MKGGYIMGVDKGCIYSRFSVTVPEVFRAFKGEGGGGYTYHDTITYDMNMDTTYTIHERVTRLYDKIIVHCEKVDRYIQLCKICRKYEKAIELGETGDAEKDLFDEWSDLKGYYYARDFEYITTKDTSIKAIITYTNDNCDTLDLTKINMYLNTIITEGKARALKEIYTCD